MRAFITITISVLSVISNAINVANIPLSKDSIETFLSEYESLLHDYYFQKQNIVHDLQKVLNKNIVFCVTENSCSVGIDAVLKTYGQFQTYIKRGLIRYTQRQQSNVQIDLDTNSASYDVSVVFETFSFIGYTKQYTVNRKKGITFDSETGKIVKIEVYSAIPAADPSTFQSFQAAVVRQFLGLKKKSEAETESLILNDLSHLITPSDNTFFGIIDKDVVILFSGFSTMIILFVFTIYCCCRFARFASRQKHTYVAVKQIDSSYSSDN